MEIVHKYMKGYYLRALSLARGSPYQHSVISLGKNFFTGIQMQASLYLKLISQFIPCERAGWLSLFPAWRQFRPHQVQADHLPHLVQTRVHPHQIPVRRLHNTSHFLYTFMAAHLVPEACTLHPVGHLPEDQAKRVDVTLLK